MKPVVGGVNITSKATWIFIQHENGDIHGITKEDPFVMLTSSEKVKIWGYDKYGAPTTPVTMRVRGAKLPPLRAVAKRVGQNVSLKITAKVPADALLTVSTVSKSNKTAEVALLYASVGKISVPASNVRGFKVCYAIYDREVGCKTFKLS